ncbi:FAD:protein FMN transferase [Chitinimonas sp. BJB300]|uniref:FAD:protein FMN transferase n=1 Tax=Chitinimonas sp. BJB300 TaxID=1559339 RepID=UPI000C121291|nr:FAD:protein FMN transferase [Chitinimonas sp. BJB300]PHV10847.1 thiamine biosynthesis protein ApbE [Chitinimonas sp. BJB300]TSJ83767.1 FAD:protein FMN transferase [Chitinimonas sp. BJB300]
MPAYVHRFTAMTTQCELSIYTPAAAGWQMLCEAVAAQVLALAQKYNYYAADSWLTRAINQRREAAVRLDAETAQVLALVREHAGRVGGVFDICHGTIADYLREALSLAEVADIRSRYAPYMGLASWSLEGDWLVLPHSETRLDLGGVIKEHAVDVAAKLLREAGVDSALVNFGGDLQVIGTKPGGERFIAAVSHPQQPSDMMFALDLQDQALTTSAHYARSRELAGRILSHIPAADTTAGNALLSASVVSPSALLSGIYSTSLLIEPTLVLPENTFAVTIDRNLQLKSSL